MKKIVTKFCVCDFCFYDLSLSASGALTSKSYDFRGRPWEITASSTFSPFNFVRQPIVLNFFRNKIIRIGPNFLNYGPNVSNLTYDFKYPWLDNYIRFSFEFVSSSFRRSQCIIGSEIFGALKNFSISLEKVLKFIGVSVFRSSQYFHDFYGFLFPITDRPDVDVTTCDITQHFTDSHNFKWLNFFNFFHINRNVSFPIKFLFSEQLFEFFSIKSSSQNSNPINNTLDIPSFLKFNKTESNYPSVEFVSANTSASIVFVSYDIRIEDAEVVNFFSDFVCSKKVNIFSLGFKTFTDTDLIRTRINIDSQFKNLGSSIRSVFDYFSCRINLYNFDYLNSLTVISLGYLIRLSCEAPHILDLLNKFSKKFMNLFLIGPYGLIFRFNDWDSFRFASYVPYSKQLTNNFWKSPLIEPNQSSLIYEFLVPFANYYSSSSRVMAKKKEVKAGNLVPHDRICMFFDYSLTLSRLNIKRTKPQEFTLHAIHYRAYGDEFEVDRDEWPVMQYSLQSDFIYESDSLWSSLVYYRLLKSLIISPFDKNYYCFRFFEKLNSSTLYNLFFMFNYHRFCDENLVIEFGKNRWWFNEYFRYRCAGLRPPTMKALKKLFYPTILDFGFHRANDRMSDTNNNRFFPIAAKFPIVVKSMNYCLGDFRSFHVFFPLDTVFEYSAKYFEYSSTQIFPFTLTNLYFLKHVNRPNLSKSRSIGLFLDFIMRYSSLILKIRPNAVLDLAIVGNVFYDFIIFLFSFFLTYLTIRSSAIRRKLKILRCKCYVTNFGNRIRKFEFTLRSVASLINTEVLKITKFNNDYVYFGNDNCIKNYIQYPIFENDPYIFGLQFCDNNFLRDSYAKMSPTLCLEKMHMISKYTNF